MNVLYFQVSNRPFLSERLRYFTSTASTWGQARSRIFEQFQNLRSGAKPHVADGIPIDHKLIFESSIRRHALVGYTVVVLAVPTYAAYTVYVLTDNDYLKKKTARRHREFITWENVQTFNTFVIVGGITLLCVSFITLKMYRATLFRIYHNEKDGLYTAVCRDNFFRLQRIKFFNNEVQELEMMESAIYNIKIKGIGYIVPPESFVNPAAFNKFMNFESPWDAEEYKDIKLRDARSKLRK